MRKPFFKKSHGAWYVHHQGRMTRLSDDKETAFQLYHELKASQAPATSSDSVAGLLNSYLEWCQKNRAERPYDWYRGFLSSFAKSIGLRLRIGGIRPDFCQFQGVTVDKEFGQLSLSQDSHKA